MKKMKHRKRHSFLKKKNTTKYVATPHLSVYPLIILAAWYCRPKPRPSFILCAHWDEIRGTVHYGIDQSIYFIDY